MIAVDLSIWLVEASENLMVKEAFNNDTEAMCLKVVFERVGAREGRKTTPVPPAPPLPTVPLSERVGHTTTPVPHCVPHASCPLPISPGLQHGLHLHLPPPPSVLSA